MSLKPGEPTALRILKLNVAGQIEQVDDGSQESMYDFRLTRPDGNTAAIEVVAAAEPESMSLWRAKQTARVGVLHDEGVWSDSLSPNVNWKRQEIRIKELLSKIDPSDDAHQRASIILDLNNRGVVDAVWSPSSKPASYDFTVTCNPGRSLMPNQASFDFVGEV